VDDSTGITLRPGTDLVGQLRAASAAGLPLLCGTADGGRTEIAAADIRRACLGEIDPYGLRLDRATIVGPLNLRAATVPVPLQFTACRFTDPVNVEGARLHALVITDGRPSGAARGGPAGSCELPGLLANGVRIERDLVLSGAVITGELPAEPSFSMTAAIWLCEAELGGRLIGAGTQVLPCSGRAMQCDRTTVAGDVRFGHGFRATGEVRLLAMRLAGSLDLSGAQLLPRDGRALDLAEATVGGSVFILDAPLRRTRPRIRGRIEMSRTVIHGQLFIRNADLEAPAPGTGLHHYNTAEPACRRPMLLAAGLTVHGQCVIETDTMVKGGVVLRGADLRAGARFDGITIANPGDLALDLSQATLGAGLELAGAAVDGSVSIANARIAGPVVLDGTSLTRPPGRRCLNGSGVRVEGDVRLQGLSALDGRVHLRGATVGGTVDARDALIVNPGGATLSLQQARIAGTVRLSGRFRSIGVVVLNRTEVGGRLRCDGAVLQWRPAAEDASYNPRESAIQAVSAVILGGVHLGWRVTAGGVDLTDASTPTLADDPATDWPSRTELGGFAYGRFAGTADAATRIAWLRRLRPYDQRSWEHAAGVLRAGGDHSGADAILVAGRRHARQTGAVPMSRGRRAFEAVQDFTVRFGFRPQRALFILLLLIAAVTVSLSLPAAQRNIRTTDQDAVVYVAGDCGGGKVRCFNPFFYAVDSVVPIIDLGQRSTWYPSADRGGTILEWWLNLCTILGWVASTIFALSFTRLGRANAP
jgi:hypothetical protein